MMTQILLGISAVQFVVFLFVTAVSSRDSKMMWVYAFNVFAATVGLVIGFLNIYKC